MRTAFNMKRVNRRDDTVFKTITMIVLVVFAVSCLTPFVLIFIVSITDNAAITKNGYSLFPEKLSLEAYHILFAENSILFRSYIVSIFITVFGTASAVLITAMAAYALANKSVLYRNVFALYFFFTMIFNPGLVPWYMMCKALGLQNNLLALFIPRLLFTPFNLFLVRNYLNGLPDSMKESAKMDGAQDFTIAFGIYFPLSVPVLAAVVLFYGIDIWNDWFNTIMLVDNSRLYPLQYMLFKLQSELKMMEELSQTDMSTKPPTESIKMATAIVTIGPIILLYPYLQRYFITGLTIGAVKG